MTIKSNNKFKINIDKVSVKKGDNIILNNVSAELFSGKIYLIIGRNGAGKSTLMNCILGIENKYSGKVNIRKGEIFEENPTASYLPEIETVPDQLKVKDYLKSFEILSRQEKRYREDLISKLEEEFDLNQVKGKTFGELSKGSKKLVMLLIAFSIESEVIILDEPFEGLDILNKKKLLMILGAEAENGKLVVIISHELDKISNKINTIICMKDGLITKEIKNNKSLKIDYIINLI